MTEYSSTSEDSYVTTSMSYLLQKLYTLGTSIGSRYEEWNGAFI
jgi:hypothetical protein